MKIKKWVKSIQTAGYNAARMVSIAGYIYKRQTQTETEKIYICYLCRKAIH